MVGSDVAGWLGWLNVMNMFSSRLQLIMRQSQMDRMAELKKHPFLASRVC